MHPELGDSAWIRRPRWAYGWWYRDRGLLRSLGLHGDLGRTAGIDGTAKKIRRTCKGDVSSLSFCLGALLFNVTYLLYHSPLLCFLPHTAFLTIPSSCVTDPLVTANFYRSRRCLTLKQNYGNSEGRWIHELCMKDLRLEFANFSRVCMNVLVGGECNSGSSRWCRAPLSGPQGSQDSSEVAFPALPVGRLKKPGLEGEATCSRLHN